MTPVEKADELYWRYYQLVADSSHPENLARELALIAVLETLKAAFYAKDEVYNFYIEVKIELENYDVKR
jgi:hypothetical protein